MMRAEGELESKTGEVWVTEEVDQTAGAASTKKTGEQEAPVEAALQI